MSNNSSAGNILLKNCRGSWPDEVCGFANICGLCSTAIWFLVLLPQVWRCWRTKSIQVMKSQGINIGLSLGWALINFTAAFNNTFFVFYISALPLYIKINAVYMPILEAMLLAEFWIFTPSSRKKWILAGICCVIWAAIITAQSTVKVYGYLEWISITLWSIETFPQVALNFRRQSTYGLSMGMIVLSTMGKTTDFLSNYLLIVPLQYVVMAYFSSTVAFISTLQVIWYWNQIPAAEFTAQDLPKAAQINVEGDLYRMETTTGCQVIRTVTGALLSTMLVCFAVAIYWRTDHWVSIFAPVLVVVVVSVSWCWFHVGVLMRVRERLPQWLIDMGF